MDGDAMSMAKAQRETELMPPITPASMYTIKNLAETIMIHIETLARHDKSKIGDFALKDMYQLLDLIDDKIEDEKRARR